MTKVTLSDLANEVAGKTKAIKLAELSALQSSNNQKILTDLQISAGELLKEINTTHDKNEMLTRHDTLVQAVDTAGLTGVISNDELPEYYELLDKIWSKIEKQ